MPRPALLLLALLASARLTVGCQTDEGKLPDVSLVEPGTGGGGAGDELPSGHIGARCNDHAECQTGFCLRPDDPDAVLTVGTAPGGLCTTPCERTADCQALDQDSTCVSFGEQAYCVQTCRFGTPLPGTPKCARRAELSCQPLLVYGGPACDDTTSCPGGSLCFDGTCSIRPTCLPRCNGDFDCPEDRYCDPKHGECVTSPPQGKGPGESCDPEADVDECRGRCITFGSGISECDENCTVGAPGGCGHPDVTTAPVVCAFFSYDFGVTQGVLDEGSCARVCRCNDDCPGAQLCLEDPFGPGPGVCVSGLAPEDSLQSCPAN